MTSCQFVECFPTEFAAVKITDIQNSGSRIREISEEKSFPLPCSFEKLKSLRDEAQKTDCSTSLTTTNPKSTAKSEEFQYNLWTLIRDVRWRLLSEVEEKLVEKVGQSKRFEVRLGDSAPVLFFSVAPCT